MPGKSRSRANLSQASTSGSQNSSRLTQTRIEDHLTPPVCLPDQVNNCVRYLVNNAGHNGMFRKADIQKVCSVKGVQFETVLERASVILKNVYGYNLLVCHQEEKAGKMYLVSNALPFKNYSVNSEEIEIKEVQKILLLLILSHIFMSNNSISEASLHSFLKSVKVDVNVRHPLFGLVKECITTLVKQKYLSTQTDAISKKVTYSWGLRVETEISKHEILKFVCKIYNDCQPTSWDDQYRAATNQHFENERLVENNNAMDVDENDD